MFKNSTFILRHQCFTTHTRSISTTVFLLQQQYQQPTIYALSTAPARSAIGVIRISGKASTTIYNKLTNSPSTTPPLTPRKATLKKLYRPGTTQFLDHSLILFFQSPHSYTGEDLLELHVHGGTAVINSILKTIQALHTPEKPIRYAEPGEFSKKAFQNGKFDLTEVEGINDLIHSETESQRVSALSSMQGSTKMMFRQWRTEIINNVALLTTVIDFGEDHDIDQVDELFSRVDSNIALLENQVNQYIHKVKRSQILLDGIKITLLGPPNAGKSSLLNLIANDEKAIVSEVAGTTRDSIDVPLDINGFKVVIGDTAGIRYSENKIELEGIKRAKVKSFGSHLNLIVLPATVTYEQLGDDLIDHLKSLKQEQRDQLFIILNKSDLLNTKTDSNNTLKHLAGNLQLDKSQFKFISCKTGDGINELIQDLTTKFKDITWTSSQDPIIISKRAQDILINDVLFGFNEFHKFKEMEDIVLAGEGLKYSIEGIGKITGEAVGVEEILGVVFSSFCIGK